MSEKNTNEIEETVAVKTFNSLAKVPSYISADILPNSNSSLLLIQVGLSQRDLNRKVKRVTLKQLVVSLQNDDSSMSSATASSFSSIDQGNVILQAKSQSGEKLVTLRSVSNGKSKSRYVEIWKHESLENVLDVTDAHEDFYTEDDFSCLKWSNDEKKVVYIAERKALEESNEKKFDYISGWGEKLANRHVPVIVIVGVDDNKVKILSEFSNIDPGQVLFGPEDKTLIFTGYDREPRQFGLVLCTNRFSGIYQCDLDGTGLVHISDQVPHARSPSMNLTQDCLVYLSNPTGGPHARCSELYVYEFSSETHRLVVPIVRSPSESFHENFPGIYRGNIPSRAFVVIGDAEYVLINSFWRSRKVILAVNLTSGKVQNLTSTGSWTLFTVWDKYVVASQGFPNQFHRLNLGVITDDKENNNLGVNWVVIDQPHIEEGVAKTLSKSTWSLLQPFADKPNLEVILHQPSETPSDKKPPLIVFPHGGPHGISVMELSINIQTLVSLGYAVIEVNYSGSIGFGQDYIDALIGKIGNLEIEEVQSSAQYFIDNNYVDRDSVALIGSSHGGFISGHLIGKFPDFYKACVLRNPVLNIGGLFAITDIPDWGFSELGLPYDLRKPSIVRPSDYTKMYESSPIANIDRIKTPILLMLGQNDKRVPYADGLQWWYYLKGQGKVDIRCKMYGETGHSLDTVEAEISCIDVISKFLKEKIGV